MLLSTGDFPPPFPLAGDPPPLPPLPPSFPSGGPSSPFAPPPFPFPDGGGEDSLPPLAPGAESLLAACLLESLLLPSASLAHMVPDKSGKENFVYYLKKKNGFFTVFAMRVSLDIFGDDKHYKAELVLHYS